MSTSDPSFAINGKVKGSYLRALDDIGRALNYLKIDAMPDHAAFLYSYLASEKLARIMHGVFSRRKKGEIFCKGAKTPAASTIYSYSKQLGCDMTKTEIDQIFDFYNNQSARKLRDRFVHEIGPSHANDIVKRSITLVPIMKRFLNSRIALSQLLTNNREETTNSKKS